MPLPPRRPERRRDAQLPTANWIGDPTPKAGFVLLCAGKPRSDLELESHARDATARRETSMGSYPRGELGSRLSSRGAGIAT